MKQHRQGERVGCYTIPYSAVSITQVLARCQPGMLSKRSHASVVQQPQQLGTQPQNPTASLEAWKQWAKSQPGSPLQQNSQISFLQQMQSSSQSQKGIRRRQPSPCIRKTCSKNPARGVRRNGGAPPRVLVIPQGGGYRMQARGQS